MKKLLTTLVAWGPWGLFLAAVLDGAGIPVPSGVDVLIVYLASRNPNDVVLFALLAVLGSVTGNLFLFWIARRGGHAFLEKRTASKHSGRFRNWFHHYGLLTVFISALVPLPVMPMKIFVICAGALDTRPLRFVLVLFAPAYRVISRWRFSAPQWATTLSSICGSMSGNSLHSPPDCSSCSGSSSDMLTGPTSVSLRQSKVHLDRRDHFDRLAIQQRR